MRLIFWKQVPCLILPAKERYMRCKEIKEKNVKNKIKINPPQGVTEGFEELGGVVVEMYELDEASYESASAKVDADRAIQKAIERKKADKRMTITNADKKGNTLAYQNYMKGDKRYKRVGEETESDKKKREMLAKTKEHDDKHDGKLAEQSGGGLAKLGPREEGKRKEKGKSKPQAIRQSKARLAALKRRLNVEEMSVKDQMAFSREYNRKKKEGLLPKRPAAKPVVNKDTRSPAEKMADAYASPRKGPGGATRAD